MSNPQKKDENADGENLLIAEVSHEYNILNIDFNELFFRYFNTFGNFGGIINNISNSLLSRIFDVNLDSHKSLNSLQTEINTLKDEIRGIKQNLPSSNEKTQLSNSNVSMNLLNYFQKEFSLFKSIRLVLLNLMEDKSEIRVICDKSVETYPIEERHIFNIELKAKKEFSLARKLSLNVDGIIPSDELKKLLDQSYIILNKSQEL